MGARASDSRAYSKVTRVNDGQGKMARPPPRRERLRRALFWLPIPTLLGAMLWVARSGPRATFDAPSLLVALNVLFSTAVSLLAAQLAGRGFAARGSPGLLMLGCGALIWSLGFLAGALVSLRHQGTGAAIQTASAWLSALCHFAGALVSLRAGRTFRRTGLALVSSYSVALMSVGLVALLAIGGWMPAFLIPGQGSTPLYRFVLGAAAGMLFMAAGLWGLSRLRPLSSFASWYALALGLFASSLFGAVLESAPGGALSWLVRASQLLGCASMLVAAIAPALESSAWGMPLEAALQESEGKYQALFSSSPDAVFLTEADGRVLCANPAACALFGAPEQELCAGGRARLLDPGDPRVAAALARARAGERVELRFVRRDGTRFEGELSSVALEGGRAFDLVRDIAERKRAEAEREKLLAEVQRHAAQLDAVFDSMEEVLLVCDEVGGIVRENPAFLRAFGSSRDWSRMRVDECIRALQLETVEGEPFQPCQSPGARALEGEVVRGMNARARLPDGRTAWFSISSAPIRAGGAVAGAVVSFADVTESRLAEQALRESEKRLAQVLRASGGGYCEHAADCSSGRHSPEFAQVLGYGPEDLPPVPSCAPWLVERLHPEDHPRFLERYREFLSGKRPILDEEVRARRKDGTWCYTRVMSAAVQRDEKGRPSFVAGLLFDIDARKRAELDREQMVAALRGADRRKDEYMAMLGHELRNPLSPIKNSVYILERADPGSEQARRALSIIDRQVNHLVRLVDDLLDASRAVHGAIQLNRERLDLCDLVRRAVDDYRSLFTEAGLALLVDTPPEEVCVEADPTRLSQVVGNLLQNAAKFTPEGGTVTVSIERDPGGRAIMRVRDTGPGIAREILPRLFEPFTQADTSLDRGKGGLGLGLSLVRRLVELHGGTVVPVSMEPGLGTMFEVALPLSPPPEPAPEVPQLPAPPRWGAPRRILVIEDNPEAANSLRAVLQLMKHAVEVAATGPDGIQKAKGFRPDVVLCDIGLPGMDGYDVARTLRADPDLERTPLVALTGYSDPEDVAKCVQAGFDHHMAKPPSVQALSRLLADVGNPTQQG